MPKTITIKKLSISEFEKARRQIEKYRQRLIVKNMKFVEKLADVGIKTAENSMGKYAGYVKFTLEKNGNEITIIAQDTAVFYRPWERGHSAEVSPLWMAEFGSGWKAEVLVEEPPQDAGQGHFPNQTNAFNPDGWKWTDSKAVDENGVSGVPLKNGMFLHYSLGETPSHPIYNAVTDMINQIETIAKGVFGGS